MPNVGCADDRHRPRGEGILHARPLAVLQPGVIRRGRDPGRREIRRRRLRRLARRGVDERAAAADERREQRVLVLFVHPLDAQEDVGPVESRHQQLRPIEPEQRDDVVADLGGRGGGERRHRRTAGHAVAAPAARGRSPQAPIVGTESWPHCDTQCAGKAGVNRAAGRPIGSRNSSDADRPRDAAAAAPPGAPPHRSPPLVGRQHRAARRSALRAVEPRRPGPSSARWFGDDERRARQDHRR